MRRLLKLAAAVLCAIVPLSARAQVAAIAPAPAGASQGWVYDLAPYGWLPTINSDLGAQGPRGRTVSVSTSADIGAILNHINFGVMGGAEARYDRFSVMTDLLYLNVSLTTDNTHLSSVNLGRGPIYIPRSQQLFTGTRLGSVVWSLAGGYTLLDGAWGNVDAVAGMRMLGIDSTTNVGLRFDIYLPNRTIALARNASATVNETYAEAIGGLTGRINIPNTKFFVPFYLDAGSGSLAFTWQGYGGLGYSISDHSDLSAGYRYVRFENGSSTGLRDISIGGALVAFNYRF
jgi:hypothetical protein